MELLSEAEGYFISLINSGVPLIHKALGKAKVLALEPAKSDYHLVLRFEKSNNEKIFSFFSSLSGGFIRIEAADFNEKLEKYRKALCKSSSIKKALSNAKEALLPYEQYLDE